MDGILPPGAIRFEADNVADASEFFTSHLSGICMQLKWIVSQI